MVMQVYKGCIKGIYSMMRVHTCTPLVRLIQLGDGAGGGEEREDEDQLLHVFLIRAIQLPHALPPLVSAAPPTETGRLAYEVGE